MAKRTAKRKVAASAVPTVIEVSIRVDRRIHDGWHVYTCKQLPGLLVVSKDDREAFDDVPASIETLIQLTFGVSCRVVHKVKYADLREVFDLPELAAAAVAERTDRLLSGERGYVQLVVQYDQSGITHA